MTEMFSWIILEDVDVLPVTFLKKNVTSDPVLTMSSWK